MRKGEMQVIIYQEPGAEVSVEELACYLRSKGAEVVLRGSFFSTFAPSIEEAAEALAKMRITNPTKPPSGEEPLYGEVKYEQRVLEGKARAGGVLYDGFMLQSYMRSLLPPAEATLQKLHLLLTPRLIATFDEADRRYHLRAVVLGSPAIISTSGIVEAPAKPREFYLQRRLIGDDAFAQARLKEKLKSRMLDYGDPRMNEVVKGYALQAMFYLLFGEAFCQEKKCRLYNAHWQEELIEAQLSEPELCEKHEKMLRQWKEKR